jgi:hypothetical protein
LLTANKIVEIVSVWTTMSLTMVLAKSKHVCFSERSFSSIAYFEAATSPIPQKRVSIPDLHYIQCNTIAVTLRSDNPPFLFASFLP